MWLFWVCWCHSLERKRRHISAILTRIFDILLIKACLFRRQWAVSTTLFWLFTTRTDRSKRVLSQFVFKTEKSQLFKKAWTFLDQIHENPPTDPTELLYKNNEKVKRRIQIHTNLRYFHHFDTEMTINQAPVHWCFVFSFFQFCIF